MLEDEGGPLHLDECQGVASVPTYKVGPILDLVFSAEMDEDALGVEQVQMTPFVIISS